MNRLFSSTIGRALSLILLLSPIFGFSQIDSLSIDVNKAYKPELAKTEKIGTLPGLPPGNTQSKPNLTYAALSKQINTSFSTPSITPMRAGSVRQPSNSPLLVKAGYGMYNTPLLGIYANSGKDDDINFAIDFQHISSAADFKIDTINYNDAKWNNTSAGLSISSKLQSSVIYGGLDVGMMGRRLYGYDSEDTTFAESELKQNLLSTGIKAGVRSAAADLEQINYDFSIDFQNASKNKLWSRFDPRENNFRAGINLMRGFSDHIFGLYTAYNSVAYNGVDSVSLSRNYLFLEPAFKLDFDKLQADLGFNLVYENISTNNTSNFFIFPDLSLSYTIVDPEVNVVVGARGELQQNTMADLFNINPYLRLENLKIMSSAMNYEGFVGIRGIALGRLNYSMDIAYGNHSNHLFFKQDTSDLRRFISSYSDVDVFRIKPQVKFVLSEKLEVAAQYEYRSFMNSPDSAFRATGQPTSVFSLGLTSRPIEKLRLTADVNSIGGIAFTDQNGIPGTLEAIVDLNLGAEYQIGDRLSIFAEASNLAGKNYRRWYDYPNLGTGVLGGLIFKL